MTDKQREVIENLDWKISPCNFADGKAGWELSKYSPAGEDFVISVEDDDLAHNVYEAYMDFDTDEHIEMWVEAKHNGINGVPSIRELCDDADAIDEMLKTLSDALHALQ